MKLTVLATLSSSMCDVALNYRVKQLQDAGKTVFVFRDALKDTEFKTMDALINEFTVSKFVVAGSYCDNDGKKIPFAKGDFEKLAKLSDVTLLEAQFDDNYNLKMPNGLEFVPDNVELLVSVMHLNKPALNLYNDFKLLSEKNNIKMDMKLQATDYQTLIDIYKSKIKAVFPSCAFSVYVYDASNLHQRVVAEFLQEERDVSIIDPRWFIPHPKMFICGGGHISYQLAQLAKQLDFEVTVMDDRQEFVTQERFPDANVIFDDFKNLPKHLIEDAYYVIVTRGHAADYICCEKILPSKYTYIGMIGSKIKVAKNRERLLQFGFSEEKVDEIHAPIGLKINSITPAEIAISIVAEIIQIKNSISEASVSSQLLSTKENGVLAIILNKGGSSPRGIGSMMLVNKKGIIDSVGGGLLEKTVIDECSNVTSIKEKEYIFDNTSAANVGMACGGKNTILYVPLM